MDTYLVLAQNLDGQEPIVKIIPAFNIPGLMRTFNLWFHKKYPEESLDDYDFYIYQIASYQITSEPIPVKFDHWEN